MGPKKKEKNCGGFFDFLPFPSSKPSLEGLIILFKLRALKPDHRLPSRLGTSLLVSRRDAKPRSESESKSKSKSESESEFNIVKVVKLNQIKLKTKPNLTGL